MTRPPVSPEPPLAQPPVRAGRWRRLWMSARVRRVVWAVAGLAAAALAYRVVVGNQEELVAGAAQLPAVRPGWVLIAAVAEAASYVAYSVSQRRLLRAAGAVVPVLVLAPIAVAAQAVADVLPAGLAVSTVFGYRMLGRYRVSAVLRLWLLVATQVLYLGVLGLLALAGLLIAGTGSAVPGLVPTAAGLVAAVAALGVLAAVLRRRGRSAWTAMDALHRRLHRQLRVPPPDPRSQRRLRAIRPTGWDWTAASVTLAGSWLADAACLALCFSAARTDTPWRGLLLAYCAGQLAASLPVTPGGLGVVEGSLTLALVAYGGAAPPTLTAVLLYRILSYWLVLPVGLVCYGWLRRRHGSTPPAVDGAGRAGAANGGPG